MSDKGGQNKRTVKKNTNKCTKTMNIKISTEDKDTVKKNSKGNKNNTSLTEQSELNIFQKTKKLENELNKLNLEIKIEEEKDFDEINSLKTNLSELETKQVELSKENKKIMSKLKGLETEVNEKFNGKFKLSKIVENSKKLSNKPDVEKLIKAREKQVITAQKNIKYMEKEYTKLSDLIEKSKNGEENKLADELSELNKKIANLEKEIQNLYTIRSEHESCEKIRLSLTTQLNVLSNEIEFESKKKNMPNILDKLPSIGNSKKEKNESKKQKEKDKNMTKSMEYSQKVRKDIFKDIEKYNSKAEIAKYKIYNSLKKDIEEKNEGNNITSPDKKNGENNNQIPKIGYSLSSIAVLKKETKYKIDDSAPKKRLFSDKDKEILQKLIPEENLNSFNERYNNIETEINKMDEEKTKENKEIKNQIYGDKMQIDVIKIKIKELNLKIINKNNILSKNRKKIMDLNKKIKELNLAIEKEKSIISKGTKNNELLKKIMEKIKSQKKKNKQNEKEGGEEEGGEEEGGEEGGEEEGGEEGGEEEGGEEGE